MPEPIFIGDDQEWADAYIGFLLLVRRHQFIHVQPRANDTNSDGCCDAYGLNIHAPDRSFHLLEKTSFKIETKNIGRWKGYIGKNMKTGSVSVREHTDFLNMWLKKFIFCGKAVGPTSNNLKLVEILATGNSVPLGKHLLGSVYHLLHQVSSRLKTNQPITNLGGPW